MGYNSVAGIMGFSRCGLPKSRNPKSRSENECSPKDSPVEHVPTVLSSNQSTPAAKESGANTDPWRTPVSTVNQELSHCDSRTQLTDLLYRAQIKLTILSGIPSLVNNTRAKIGWMNQRQHANQHRLHRLNVHSVAVVVQYYLRLLYDHMWNDREWNRSAGNVCAPIRLA